MKPEEVKSFIEERKKKDLCQDCGGKGYTYTKFGKTQTCWKCLREGRLNQDG